MKLRVIVIGLLCGMMGGKLWADELPIDTIVVDEVKVISSRSKHLSDQSKSVRFDQQQLDAAKQRTVSEMLMLVTPLNIKSYGSPGASSSLSIRGAGASHTQVNWNGFPINSVTLGSSDLSNLPAGGFNSIDMVYGASGAIYGSGTFGGAVNLNNDMRWGTPVPKSRLSLQHGSFGTWGGNLSVNAGGERLRYSGSVWGNKSDADFKYYDYIKRKELNRKNADYEQYGFIQNLYGRLGQRAFVDGGVWYQVKDLNLPAIIGANPNNVEQQSDSTLRAFARFKQAFNRSGLQIKAAYFYDYQLYTKKINPTDAEYSIYSKIISDKYYADANYRYFLTEYLTFDAGATYSHIKAKVDAYQRPRKENGLALVSALKYQKSRLSGNISVRKEWNDAFSSQWLLGVGASYQIIPEEWSVRFAASEKFRKPTFNDLYWVPGGNPDLVPEKGYTTELGTTRLFDLGSWGQFTVDLAAYYAPIDNMIRWQPAGAIWEAKNFYEVLTRGVEFDLNHEISFGEWKVKSGASIDYNKATIESTTNPDAYTGTMTYSPLWSGLFHTQADYKRWNIGASLRYADQRYYVENEKLDGYEVVNAFMGYQLPLGTSVLGIRLSADNVFDIDYELIRSYPMPGRNFNIQLSYTF
ncbi:TonB-dependent receptor [Puteibacter caeruleilacunae]|nr:TonB-dependent receptor [Puteibacter caeruleilacunae]